MPNQSRSSVDSVTAEQVARYLFKKFEPLGKGEPWECATENYQLLRISEIQDVMDAIKETQNEK